MEESRVRVKNIITFQLSIVQIACLQCSAWLYCAQLYLQPLLHLKKAADMEANAGAR